MNTDIESNKEESNISCSDTFKFICTIFGVIVILGFSVMGALGFLGLNTNEDHEKYLYMAIFGTIFGLFPAYILCVFAFICDLIDYD